MDAAGTFQIAGYLPESLADPSVARARNSGLRAFALSLRSALSWTNAYWLVWVVVLAINHATTSQADMKWWLLSSEAWWFAPMALAISIPRKPADGPWILLPMLVLSFVVNQWWILQEEWTRGVLGLNLAGALGALNFVSQWIYAAITLAVLFSYIFVWAFARHALMTSLAVGVAAAMLYSGAELLKLDLWRARPLGQHMRLFEANMLSLAIAAGVARLLLARSAEEWIVRRPHLAFPAGSRGWIALPSSVGLVVIALAGRIAMALVLQPLRAFEEPRRGER